MGFFQPFPCQRKVKNLIPQKKTTANQKGQRVTFLKVMQTKRHLVQFLFSKLLWEATFLGENPKGFEGRWTCVDRVGRWGGVDVFFFGPCKVNLGFVRRRPNLN